jgi:hypothetical protein
MSIDRIQQAQGLRVERTGSESERRHHAYPEEDFSELLEESLEGQERQSEGNGPKPQGAGPSAHGDTVSLSTANFRPAAGADRVSISTQGLVGAESLRARQGALRLSLAQRIALSLKGFLAPPADRAEVRDPENGPPAEADARSIDTVV